MVILITGGSGFIGRNLVEYYSPRCAVLAPRHGELELLDEDAVRNYLRKHAIDVIIHSASLPGHRNAKDTRHLFYKNVRMFFNLVRNADRFGKMIFLSSGAAYDMRHYLPRMKEEYFDSHVPEDEHGFSKYVCAKTIEHLDNIVELRLFGVFGKYEDYAIRFISNAICKTLFDLPITIKQNRRFDYLYIDDLGPVIDHFLENAGKHKCYNVTPDAAIELRTLAEKVRTVSEKDLPILIAQPGMGLEYSGDNDRLKEEIPRLRFTDMDDAIRQLHDWYLAGREKIDRELLLFDK